MLRKILIGFSILFLTSAGVFAFGCSAFGVPSFYRMVKHPAVTDGWIVKKEPDNRSNVKYAFKVGSTTYEGEGGIGDAFDAARPGDPVKVIYDPIDPTWSTLGDPKQRLLGILFPLTLFSIIGGFFLALSLTRLFRLVSGRKTQ